MDVVDESPNPLGADYSDAADWQGAAELTPSDQDRYLTTHSPSATATAEEDEDLTQQGATRGEVFYSPAPFKESRSRNITVDIPRAVLVTPRSRHHGFTPPFPLAKERDALKSLMDSRGSPISSTEWVEFDLEQFSFYITTPFADEMRSPQRMNIKAGHGRYYFDGVLSNGRTKHYVQMVEVIELPIGNYGRQFSSTSGQIWIRSKLNQNRELYYRLKTPAIEYERFYTPFLWVADLAKHVVDFSFESESDVCIVSFKEDFYAWLMDVHGATVLHKWLSQHPSPDFRTSVAASIEFIWKEMNGVLGQKKAASLSLFQEVMTCTQFRPVSTPFPVGGMIEPVKRGDEPQYPTVVTPYVKECFGQMVLGKMLRVPSDDTTCPVRDAQPPQNPWILPQNLLSEDAVARIKVGDTISTPRDELGVTNTKWQHVASKYSADDDGRWFGLVQKVHINRKGRRSFDVTWLYRPADTPCGVMKYPWPNELFLSDHCTCEEGATNRIKDDEVLAVHPINWVGNPNNSDHRFFVRQIYMVHDRRWVTLEKSQLTCAHGEQEKDVRYKSGDTILATLRSAAVFSEPYEVVKVFRQGEQLFVRLRVLLRRDKVDFVPGVAPNELVYTEQVMVVKKASMNVLGRCHVRFFRPDESIPSPYNRGGTGNLFYIRSKLEAGRCVPLGAFPTSLRQGFDPRCEVPKLRGLDLFCGAGNFGRGLEDGGVVEMRWANDIWDKAIHTYMANSLHKEAHPFLGSVDDLLRKAMAGDYSETVPRPGEVDFISAGSPCPGFSLLTPDKTTLRQIKNQSLVASFAAFVDFYRPKYGVLENVMGIVPRSKEEDENVLSQLFCALVGMGYQTQVILGDAWSHGAPQTRTRVFLYFAKPGLRLPNAPLLSHSQHPESRSRALGMLCTGEPFVQRIFGPTAFKYVTAAEATADLPPVHDARVDACVDFPDHRVSFSYTIPRQFEIAAIPVHPFNMNFAKAWNQGRGVMSRGDRELFPADGSSR
ncbi:hypothetical protein QBC34DRAFT_495826, partial [Podospora aff. communis PSN243]